jgi:hypothetical protein
MADEEHEISELRAEAETDIAEAGMLSAEAAKLAEDATRLEAEADQLENGHHRPIRFTVDGEEFETDDPEQRAAEMLERYAKLSPENYQLGELRGDDPKPKLFKSDDIVHIRSGARFVSVRIGPGPVE